MSSQNLIAFHHYRQGHAHQNLPLRIEYPDKRVAGTAPESEPLRGELSKRLAPETGVILPRELAPENRVDLEGVTILNSTKKQTTHVRWVDLVSQGNGE